MIGEPGAGGRLCSVAEYSYHVPNGVWVPGNPSVSVRIMNSLKKQGLRPGVSDIVIALPRGTYHGAYLELKRGAKEVRDIALEQQAWLTRMRGVGYYAGVAEGLDSAIAHARNYMAGVQAPPFPWELV